MTYLAGKVVVDVDAGAPNNGRGEDNVGVYKKIVIRRPTGSEVYPYVSAQAFRRWLRDSLPAGEPRSPVTRTGSGKKQQAYTAGRPDQFLDDDIFGYMVAVKKNEGGTCQRDTVLATGTLVSVTAQQVTRDFGTMTRGFEAGADPVIHEHELYTADLAGDVLLDLPRVGTFETNGHGLRISLTPTATEQALQAGAQPVTFRGVDAVRLPITERRRRVAVLLRTLAAVRGGAKRALHYGDRSPALVLLAPLKGGVNPFTRVLAADGGRTTFDVDVFREEAAAWADEIDGTIRLGWAPGFLREQRDKARTALHDLIEGGQLILDHPRVVLNHLADAVEAGTHDMWFEEPGT